MEGVKNWKRVLAFFVDLAIVDLIITKPLNNLVDVKEVSSINEVLSLLSLNNLFLISLLIGLLGVLYWTILEFKIGQTLGALIFNLRMRTEDNKEAEFGRVFLRNITKLSIIFLLIDSIHIFFSPKKQRFFEKLSKTRTMEEG
ncbi:MAG: hypothetical protein CMH63_01790 [Nanoarchaeota archaeon]|jgi:uncharacterized RDD family membrane protein YckC|nr:hypothetical protein [Nanoarchaeota archaeon]|tara:strand:+ start:42720 stop:43148 length:429 start_codon:yes stop_codon:yes gene_type:complete